MTEKNQTTQQDVGALVAKIRTAMGTKTHIADRTSRIARGETGEQANSWFSLFSFAKRETRNAPQSLSVSALSRNILIAIKKHKQAKAALAAEQQAAEASAAAVCPVVFENNKTFLNLLQKLNKEHSSGVLQIQAHKGDREYFASLEQGRLVGVACGNGPNNGLRTLWEAVVLTQGSCRFFGGEGLVPGGVCPNPNSFNSIEPVFSEFVFSNLSK